MKPMDTPEGEANRSTEKKDRPFLGQLATLLSGTFNVLSLALCLAVTSLPVITAPIATHAASMALHRWRHDGDDAVMRVFWSTLITHPLRITATVGPAFGVIVLGSFEYLQFRNRSGVVDAACMGIAAITIACGMAFLAYLLALLTRSEAIVPTDLWKAAATFVGKTSYYAVPIMAVTGLAFGLTMLIDPSFAAMLLGVALLWVWQRTAEWGFAGSRRSHTARD